MQTTQRLDDQFVAVLDDSTSSEQTVQEFLERNTPMFYPAYQHNHGVHLAAIITKFKLDTSLTTDFAYLTKSSAEWDLILVELEHPGKQLFTKAGIPTADLTSAISQVNSWRAFIEKHAGEVIRKIAPLRKPLTENRVRFKYVLVIGRTIAFEKNQIAVDALAQLQRDDFKILTYDSLIHAYQTKPSLTLDVLSQKGQKFAFKHRHRTATHIFSWLNSNDVHLEAEDVAFYKSHGYDMDAWLKGQSLAVNGKDTVEKSAATFSKVFNNVVTLPSQQGGKAT